MGWTTAGNIRGPQGVQGPEGPQGQTGPVGPASLNPRGPWESGNSYAISDVVTWGGSSYYATAPRAAGSAPPTGTIGDPGTEDTNTNAGWAHLAVQGAQGPQGSQGIQGNPGIQGQTGSTGTAGTRGSKWFIGTGTPGVISGSLPDDQYLDQATGDVYTLS